MSIILVIFLKQQYHKKIVKTGIKYDVDYWLNIKYNINDYILVNII